MERRICRARYYSRLVFLWLFADSHAQSPHFQGAGFHPNVHLSLLSFVMVTRELSMVKIVLERAAAMNSVDVQHADPPHALSNITPHQLVGGCYTWSR